MYGTNPVEKQELRPDGSLYIHKIFYTFQGEGPFIGWPAVFIRLAGCNLRCFWCDTEFDVHTLMTVDQVVSGMFEKLAIGQAGVNAQAALGRVAYENHRPIIVLTGGEPMRQNIVPLIERLVFGYNLHVQIETAGTLWIDGLESIPTYRPDGNRGLSIVCSPKTPQIHPELALHVTAYKYVVRENELDRYDGLPNRSTQMQHRVERLYRPPDHSQVPIYVSPCDEALGQINRRNLKAASDAALAFGYRLTYQLHKQAGVE